MVGITIASMIRVASIMILASSAPTGPAGSRTPPEQPASGVSAKAASARLADRKGTTRTSPVSRVTMATIPRPVEGCDGPQMMGLRRPVGSAGRSRVSPPQRPARPRFPRTPMNRLFAYLIGAAMLLGVAVGWAVNQYASPAGAKDVADNLSIVTNVFLRLIQMIIAPLVISTLIAGIAHMEDSAAIGRVGIKTLGWFITASIVSLTIGLIMVHLLQPGVGMHLTAPAVGAANSAVDMTRFNLKDFVSHIFPRSIVEAMANNEILQIVIFSVFAGTAVSQLDDKAPQVLALVEQIAAIMLKVTGYVMRTAP